jgi:hypothetical protein
MQPEGGRPRRMRADALVDNDDRRRLVRLQRDAHSCVLGREAVDDGGDWFAAGGLLVEEIFGQLTFAAVENTSRGQERPTGAR